MYKPMYIKDTNEPKTKPGMFGRGNTPQSQRVLLGYAEIYSD